MTFRAHLLAIAARLLIAGAPSNPPNEGGTPEARPLPPQVPTQRPPADDNDYSGLSGVQLAECCCFAALVNDDSVLWRRVDEWAASESGW